MTRNYFGRSETYRRWDINQQESGSNYFLSWNKFLTVKAWLFRYKGSSTELIISSPPPPPPHTIPLTDICGIKFQGVVERCLGCLVVFFFLNYLT